VSTLRRDTRIYLYIQRRLKSGQERDQSIRNWPYPVLNTLLGKAIYDAASTDGRRKEKRERKQNNFERKRYCRMKAELETIPYQPVLKHGGSTDWFYQSQCILKHSLAHHETSSTSANHKHLAYWTNLVLTFS
jgi:hypothetical protein